MRTLSPISRCLTALAVAAAFSPASAENLFAADTTTTTTLTSTTLTGLSLTCPSAADTFYVHQRTTCQATASFVDGSSVVLNPEKGGNIATLTKGLVWSTDNSAVTAPTTCNTSACSNPLLVVDKSLTADGSVNVTAALTVGTVTKTASASVKLYAPIALNVTCPSSVVSGGKVLIAVVAQNDPACAAGTYFSDGIKGDVTHLVQWSASDTTLATVTNPTLAIANAPVFYAPAYKNGLIQAATVTAASKVNIQAVGAGLTGSAPLAITVASTTTPTTSQSTLLVSCPQTLAAGKQAKCYAGFRLADNTTKLATVVWSSSDSSIASIDADGVITAGKLTSNGKATITATYTPSGSTTPQTATATVSVVAAASLSGLVVSCTENLSAGASGVCRAGGVYSDDTRKDITPTWSSSDSSVVTVDETGKITAKTVTAKSTATISAVYTDGSVTQKGSATVTVTPATTSTPPSTSVTPLSATTIDCFFAWAETQYSQLFPTNGATVSTVSFGPYSFRQYPLANTYLGVETLTNTIIYVGPLSGGQLLRLGTYSSVWAGPSGCK